MAIKLNSLELDVTKEIINIGISKAADSLSFFTKGKVLIRLMDLKVDIAGAFPLSRKYPTNKNYLLKTSIKGDLTGEAYLLFNEVEVENIVDGNLPESIKNDPAAKAEMTEGFLLEIDNIITASVVTQFSNIFQRKTYGDVPSLKIISGNEINEYLSANHNSDLNLIYFNARFMTENTEINPEFIWLMDDTFFEEVKSLISDEKKMEMLQNTRPVK